MIHPDVLIIALLVGVVTLLVFINHSLERVICLLRAIHHDVHTPKRRKR